MQSSAGNLCACFLIPHFKFFVFAILLQFIHQGQRVLPPESETMVGEALVPFNLPPCVSASTWMEIKIRIKNSLDLSCKIIRNVLLKCSYMQEILTEIAFFELESCSQSLCAVRQDLHA
jgi:hypothetical protein